MIHGGSGFWGSAASALAASLALILLWGGSGGDSMLLFAQPFVMTLP